jgi:hypothetical protein
MAKESLCCLGKENIVRKACIIVSQHNQLFGTWTFNTSTKCQIVATNTAYRCSSAEWVFLCIIVANCIALAMGTNRPGLDSTSTGMALKYINYGFIGVFTLEAIIKIIALGFILSPGTYLRDGVLIPRSLAYWEINRCTMQQASQAS